MEKQHDTIIVAGPVIIESGKVLLNRETRTKYRVAEKYFMFPGGCLDEGDTTTEAACRREVMEELGINIEILQQLETITTKHLGNADTTVVLHHFLAKRIGEINPGEETIEWGWYDIHNLPKDSAPNVRHIIQTCIDKKMV